MKTKRNKAKQKDVNHTDLIKTEGAGAREGQGILVSYMTLVMLIVYLQDTTIQTRHVQIRHAVSNKQLGIKTSFLCGILIL